MQHMSLSFQVDMNTHDLGLLEPRVGAKAHHCEEQNKATQSAQTAEQKLSVRQNKIAAPRAVLVSPPQADRDKRLFVIEVDFGRQKYEVRYPDLQNPPALRRFPDMPGTIITPQTSTDSSRR